MLRLTDEISGIVEHVVTKHDLKVSHNRTHIQPHICLQNGLTIPKSKCNRRINFRQRINLQE